MNSNERPIQVDPKIGLCKLNELEVPAIGFGTYPLREEACTESVQEALKAGYQIFDTATYYENFKAIAKALKGQERSRLYLISKVWHDQQHPEGVRNDLKRTLLQLETNYLDAYLLHWPNSAISIASTLTAMDELRRERKIRHIGMSNVTVNHLKKALEFQVPISWVQVEMHPNFCDFDLLAFCSKHSIIVQAWRPLDLGRVSVDPMFVEIGNRYQKSASQVALRWIVQHGCIPLPGSKNSAHIQQNREIFDFMLSEEEMQTIDNRAKRGKRFRIKAEDGLGFTDEFDFSYEQCWP